MKCENSKCNKEHDGSYGSGRFCCDKCARSFSTIKVDNDELKDSVCPKCGGYHRIRKRASDKLTLCVDCGGKGVVKDNRYTGVCIYCENTLKTSSKLYCSKKCQTEYNYLIYINKWKLGSVDGRKGKMSVSTHIRRYMFRKYNSCCCLCGWGEINKSTGSTPLDLHHKDGDSTNNDESNLLLLCPNCHSLTSTYKSLNKNSSRIYRYK